MATFSAPDADDVTIYVATSPARATDGRFLSENLEDLALLTTAEIASGRWLDSDQLDPGLYYVMVSALDYDCESCSTGYSAVLPLTIPKPKQRFRAGFKGGYIATLKLVVSPLGEQLPYKVCWARTRGRKCIRARVDGYDWNQAASDELDLDADKLKLGKRKTTRFVWYVKGKRVASSRLLRFSKG